MNNHILYLTQDELLGLVPQPLKDRFNETINKGKTRFKHGTTNSWEHHDGLLTYTSIPEATAIKYDLPTVNTLIRQQLAQLVKPLTGAKDYYLTQQETYGYAGDLAQVAAWLMFLASVTRKQATVMGYPALDHLYTDALEIMAKLPRWKASSLQILKRKLKPFNQYLKAVKNQQNPPLSSPLSSLISKKYGNSNSQKVTPEQEALMIQIYSQPNKPSIEQTWMMYLRQAGEMVAAYEQSQGAHGWDKKCLVSYSTVKHLLTSKRVQQMVYEQRHGYQAYRNEYEVITPRENASFANALWVIDGSPVHRYYYDPKEKKAYSRINVFVVLDAHSWTVLGFWVSETEDTQAVKGALRSACALGGHMPHQIQFDNSRAIKSNFSQQCMNVIAEYCTPTNVGNARAKVVENFFKMFNEQVLKFRPGYTGSPVMAKSLQNQPNREALALQVKQGLIPSKEQATKELHEDFTVWNNRIMKKYGKSPLQRYRESMQASQERQRKYTKQHAIDAFYEMPGKLKQVKVLEQGNQVMRTKFYAQDFIYTTEGIKDCLVMDPEFNNYHIGEKFQIKYDPLFEDTKVYLYQNEEPYHFNGKRVAMIPREKMHMAIADHETGEMAKIQQLQAAKKEQRKLAQAELNKRVAITQVNGTYTEAITENAFDKEVLNAAKANRMEQIINGDDYRLNQNSVPESKGAPAGAGGLSRFALEEEPEEILEPINNTKPIERWDTED
ncbi:MAG: transposase family protein [Fulvivirga sp.]